MRESIRKIRHVWVSEDGSGWQTVFLSQITATYHRLNAPITRNPIVTECLDIAKPEMVAVVDAAMALHRARNDGSAQLSEESALQYLETACEALAARDGAGEA